MSENPEHEDDAAEIFPVHFFKGDDPDIFDFRPVVEPADEKVGDPKVSSAQDSASDSSLKTERGGLSEEEWASSVPAIEDSGPDSPSEDGTQTLSEETSPGKSEQPVSA